MMRVELVEHNPTTHMTGIRRYTLMLAQPALRQLLRQQGLARAAGFTWQRTALATLGVYRRAAADYPPPPATPPC